MTLMPLDPDRTAIFLDVDGTLLQIVDDPASVAADDNPTTLPCSIKTRLGGTRERLALLLPDPGEQYGLSA
jgi:hypothetical protein